eukprot:659341-Rhodomonas_salina.1
MTFFGFVLGLFGLLTTTSGSEIQEPSVAVLAGTEFAHPDTLQGLDLNNYDHLLAVGGFVMQSDAVDRAREAETKTERQRGSDSRFC